VRRRFLGFVGAVALLGVVSGCSDPEAEREAAVNQLCAEFAEGAWRDLPESEIRGVPAATVRSSDHVDRDWLLDTVERRCPDDARDYLAALDEVTAENREQDEKRRAKREADRQRARERAARQLDAGERDPGEREASEQASDSSPSGNSPEARALFVGYLRDSTANLQYVDESVLLTMGADVCRAQAGGLTSEDIYEYITSRTGPSDFSDADVGRIISAADRWIC
jgi:hypothetical protein